MSTELFGNWLQVTRGGNSYTVGVISQLAIFSRFTERWYPKGTEGVCRNSMREIIVRTSSQLGSVTPQISSLKWDVVAIFIDTMEMSAHYTSVPQSCPACPPLITMDPDPTGVGPWLFHRQ